MDQQQKTNAPNPGTAPPQTGQSAAGGQEIARSEETRNQEETSQRSRAESGTTEPSRPKGEQSRS